MAELKTKVTDQSVEAFLETIDNEQKKEDCKVLLDMMKEISGEKPKLWGNATVGFGSYHYKGKSGREGEWYITGFSPRKQNISVHVMAGFEKFPDLMKQLGKHKSGVGCLYINKLADIDISILKLIIVESVAFMKKNFPN